ncbi:hypothetical protein CAOG_00003 [Capsaspora owczarzaki ATCC 30864]|uniref:PSI domain-containing protein n=1 Tax=Capsaspora owczarzaki (strain ATCC 30864) TaxID=595528 RepID=A0A0D2X029_CAPO3|nr:hypothetical protein CAOG_00003 [Capsaspora owczarzaki ATCC 30864]KJE88339.1 hypothetical protein CAOG_000003 [Capsaspora owczarzaki ATCC 30864]|eukprot:XP_004364874.1 hypothetical protein CAOG_00003 [Capsaspora owczarzaki ATCC 30864]
MRSASALFATIVSSTVLALLVLAVSMPAASPNFFADAATECGVNRTTCSKCVDSTDCVWCSAIKECRKGSEIGPSNTTGCSGNDWQWKQCDVSGQLLVIVIPSVIGGVVLIFGIWLYCCCRRRSKRNFQKYLERVETDQRRQQEERIVRSEERRSERQVKTDAIRMKYGLLKDKPAPDAAAV